MDEQAAKARTFIELHVKGDPVIIYNVWDGGSANTIAGCGAKAIATGDHPVGFAHGFTNDDFDEFTFDIYLPTIKEIVKRIGDLPFSVDISNAEGLSGEALEDRVETVINAGAVGINYEDRMPDDSGVQTIEEQADRIKTIRAKAESMGIPLFINARTDIFSLANKNDHAGLLEEAIQRANAFKEAGASGFFVPALIDLDIIKELTEKVDLPVNIIRLWGAPSTKDLASANVARISYGPMPQLAMTEWLKKEATAALKGEV
jgi:2-methylisocitrate lyase-like PEP mutase family enzyme